MAARWWVIAVEFLSAKIQVVPTPTFLAFDPSEATCGSPQRTTPWTTSGIATPWPTTVDVLVGPNGLVWEDGEGMTN